MDWYPAPDETTLVRTPIRFATGYAHPVLGSRWFRDTERRDIQAELPGWPAGPAYTLHSKSSQQVDKVAGGFLSGVVTAVQLAVEAVVGGNSAGKGDGPSRSAPQDPANESEDFPVMWAAPGTLARTVPWQLDPARRPEHYRVDAVLTERRLLFLGVGRDMTAPAEVLWESDRGAVAEARPLPFSEGGHDLRLTFTDGSWVRLATGDAAKLVGFLSDSRRPVPASDLTTGQQDRLSRFRTELPADAQEPLVFRLPSGVFLVEAKVPAKRGSGLFETHTILMGETGEPARPQPGDL